MAKQADPQDRSVCKNRTAHFRFEVLEKVECGIVLQGAEVKSLRERAASLDESYARLDGGEVWLVGCHIAPYPHAPMIDYQPTRKRKLLLHAAEIRKLKLRVEQKGMTLVPLRMYFSERGIAKLTLAVARGKTHSDKRASMKEREQRREMDRAVRRRR